MYANMPLKIAEYNLQVQMTLHMKLSNIYITILLH
jgi:hypothetical protein